MLKRDRSAPETVPTEGCYWEWVRLVRTLVIEGETPPGALAIARSSAQQFPALHPTSHVEYSALSTTTECCWYMTAPCRQ